MAAEFSPEQAQERLAELLERADAGEDIVITRPGGGAVALRRAAAPAAFAWGAPDGAGERGLDVGTDYSPAELGLR